MPDWTNDNEYLWTDALSRREWAWEFLRRNPEFRSDWQMAQMEYGIFGYDAGTTTMVCLEREPSLFKWGCLYTASPDYDARMGVVFWSPDLCTSVLRVRAFPVIENVPATPFSLDDLTCPSVLLELPEGPQHLLFTEGGRTLQLVIDGADAMRPMRLMVDGAPDRKLAAPQLRALQCFQGLRLSGHLHPSYIQREPLSLYRRLVLRALDGDLAGASQQDIARHVLSDYSDDKWRTPERPLRERIRRALRRGHALMHRGYRDLLS
jgi:hypothetical protein